MDLSYIRRRFEDAREFDRENREAALDDLQFSAGEQWPENIKNEREAAGRPVITVNRMPQFIRQVTGDIRRTNPAIDVMPGDADADNDMADVLAGIIRGIEYRCDGSTVYERAAESAAACGMGHFRVYYEAGPSGNEIVIEGIDNPFAVYWDPMAKHPTRKDARYCFITEKMDRDDFVEMYPKARTTTFGTGDVTDGYRDWYTQETITVAEYFWKEDGRVFWQKMTGDEVLEGPIPWPGKRGDHIPVFAVMGEETHVGDRIVRSSVIRHAKDSQRLYNYWRSTHAEVVALQPKAPYKLTPKQIEGWESYWNNANTANYPYLPYNPDERAPGAPQRETPPVASPAMLNEISIAADEMKATTGIYDAALGDQGNEKSGVAIRQRQLESDISTSIYVDNLSKAIAQCGRVIVDMIPAIYDTTRQVRTVEQDGGSRFVDLNVPMQTPFGPIYANDPSFGSYDVRIKTGPSYTTQRQEAVESLIEFVRAVPQAAQVAGDLIARNMDWPGAEELADRLAMMLPMEMRMRDAEEMTPEQQQQMAQAMQQQQAMQQFQQAMQQSEVTKATAEAQEAQADAVEAQADAEKAQIEAAQARMAMAAQSGQLNEAIAEIVRQEVARALMARSAPMGSF